MSLQKYQELLAAEKAELARLSTPKTPQGAFTLCCNAVLERWSSADCATDMMFEAFPELRAQTFDCVDHGKRNGIELAEFAGHLMGCIKEQNPKALERWVLERLTPDAESNYLYEHGHTYNEIGLQNVSTFPTRVIGFLQDQNHFEILSKKVTPERQERLMVMCAGLYATTSMGLSEITSSALHDSFAAEQCFHYMAYAHNIMAGLKNLSDLAAYIPEKHRTNAPVPPVGAEILTFRRK